MEKSESRKRFIRGLVAIAAGTAVTGLFFWKKKQSEDKVSMLLPNGKLVEMSKSDVEKAKNGRRASNEDVMAWMDSKEPKSSN
jgi:hypothetical protein